MNAKGAMTLQMMLHASNATLRRMQPVLSTDSVMIIQMEHGTLQSPTYAIHVIKTWPLVNSVHSHDNQLSTREIAYQIITVASKMYVRIIDLRVTVVSHVQTQTEVKKFFLTVHLQSLKMNKDLATDFPIGGQTMIMTTLMTIQRNHGYSTMEGYISMEVMSFNFLPTTRIVLARSL